ncbi:MAG TPA: MarR family transcriptional regulator [Solirubrobacteraceae bacterium]|jgi:DNA-binding MarR family transcriptional regulator|nr:MarR family transcriptional regulator [Solirubrobacteraceae bacterium]
MATTSAPSIDELATTLRIAIARSARRLRQENVAELSATQASALATVERYGPLTPSELASRERIQRPTATRMLARLEAQGLVARTPDPRDGRSSLIALTDEGVALLASQRTRKNAYLAGRLEALPARDRDTLERAAELLERLLGEDVP